MDVQRIIDTFELLPDWNQRYEVITELGSKLALLSEEDKTDQNLVQGCTTRTWVIGHPSTGAPTVIEYKAYAEGALVRGLIALLLLPFQGKTPQEILDEDPREYIAKLGLEEHLSPNRRVGMYAFIAKLKAIARECSDGA